MKLIYITLLSFLLPLGLHAQQLGNTSTTPNNTSTSDINQAVKSIEGITAKMLELISGPKGQERNWEEFRTLFLPTVQFIALNPQARAGDQVRAFNLEEFIRTFGPLYAKEGFQEEALDIRVNEFNGMANAFQSFTARNATGTYNARGINNFILVHLEDRWWIASSTWTNEDATHPLPEKLNDAANTTSEPTQTSGSGKLGGAKKGKIILKR